MGFEWAQLPAIVGGPQGAASAAREVRQLRPSPELCPSWAAARVISPRAPPPSEQTLWAGVWGPPAGTEAWEKKREGIGRAGKLSEATRIAAWKTNCSWLWRSHFFLKTLRFPGGKVSNQDNWSGSRCCLWGIDRGTLFMEDERMCPTGPEPPMHAGAW